MWKMFAFVKILPSLRPTPGALRKMLMVLFVAAVGVGGFFWGRNVASQTPRSSREPVSSELTPVSDRSNDAVVAYLWGNIKITRQELGEYLIERQGRERIEALVNRRIIELVCREKGIFVSDAEVEQQYDDDIKALGTTSNVTRQDFVVHILRRFNKSEFEWKEDVIRPRIAMNKLVRSEITVSAEDIEKAYDAMYGPKVECRMIVMRGLPTPDGKGRPDSAGWNKVYEQVRSSEAAFDRIARDKDIQLIDVLRSNAGKAPAIHKNFGDLNIEHRAFELQPGQVSMPIDMPDHSGVILKCDRLIPADVSRPQLNDRVRAELYQNVLQLKISQRVPEKLKELRRFANPEIPFLKQRVAPRPQQTAALSLPDYSQGPLPAPPASALTPQPAAQPSLPPDLPKVQAPALSDKDLIPPPASSLQPTGPTTSTMPFVPSAGTPPVSVNPLAGQFAPDTSPAATQPSILPVPPTFSGKGN